MTLLKTPHLHALLCLVFLLNACVGERRQNASDTQTTTSDVASGNDITTPPGDTTTGTDSVSPGDTSVGDVAGDDADAVAEDVEPPPTEIPFEELAGAAGEAYCNIIENCLVLENDFWFFQAGLAGPGTDREFCENIAGALFDDELITIKALVEAGRIIYDGEAALACYTEWGSACVYSFNFEPWDEGCPNVFKGTVPVGSACHVSQECAGDNYCSHVSAAGGPSQCPGSCAQRHKLGAACERDVECPQAGLLGHGDCYLNAGARTCVDERLSDTIASEGQPCGAAHDTETNVVLFTECAEGLACTSDSGVGVCIKPVAAGQGCDVKTDLCEFAHVCIGASGLTTCEPIVLRQSAGESCGPGNNFDVPQCNLFRGLNCGLSNTCISVGDGTLGSPCANLEFNSLECNDGLYCDSSSNACLQKKDNDEVCRFNAECLSNECGNQGLCAPYKCD